MVGRPVSGLWLRVERVRDFGEVYLALALWRRLGLHRVLEEPPWPRNGFLAFGRLRACTVAMVCGILTGSRFPDLILVGRGGLLYDVTSTYFGRSPSVWSSFASILLLESVGRGVRRRCSGRRFSPVSKSNWSTS